MSWGHVTGGNNCSLDDARRTLHEIYKEVRQDTPLLCHNAKFDMEVAEDWFQLELPPWHCFHDTMFLAFLDDPHQRQLGLKPTANRLLGMPPDEQDHVKTWLLEHRKQLEAEYGIKVSEGNTGAFIAYAPGNVVEPYANGDVIRTEKLFDYLYNDVCTRGMVKAYERELQCLPILLRNEQEGIRVDEAALARDQPIFEAAKDKADIWLRKKLGSPDLNLDSTKELVEVLDRTGMVTDWVLTEKGNKSTAKKNLTPDMWRDPKAAQVFAYRQKCGTVLETFIRPWQQYSMDGIMHTNWNQVRQSKRAQDKDDTSGTRTGRPSSDTPNFLNMPKNLEDKGDGFIHPAFLNVPQLPWVRKYILPDYKDHVIGRRDYNQQEIRILAHFEDGELQQNYRINPRWDVHDFVKAAILEMTGIDLPRGAVKTINFGMLYGMGLKTLAARLRMSYDEAKLLKRTQLSALPGLAALDSALKARGRAGDYIQTWGGRQYYCEPPFIFPEGGQQTFEYKLLNYLIQGSAADCTKESLIRYDSIRKDGRFLLTVYDENNMSVPKDALKSEMLLMRDAMMSVEFDVPMLSDGEWGMNLGELSKLKEPAPTLKAYA